MSIFLVTALVVCLVSHGTDMTTASAAWDDQDFFRNCPPSRCSKDGPEIRFPLRLDSSNTPSSCGATCAKLACSGQSTIMLHPLLGPCNVNSINYTGALLNITPLTSACTMIQNLISISSPPAADHHCTSHYSRTGMLVGCSREFTPSGITQYPVYDDRGGYYASASAADTIAGPISCLSNKTHYSYLVATDAFMYDLPLDCKVISDAALPIFGTGYYGSKHDVEEGALQFYDIAVDWSEQEPLSIPSECQKCEQNRQRCAFSSQRNETFCLSQPHKGSRVKIIAATSSSAAFVVLLLMVAPALYLPLKTRYNEEIHLKVEMFLKTYGTSKPTRYTSSEIKKITRRFKDKLGRGGFGCVYKGELPNGVPVAIKMLEKSNGEGQEFINEVATIGRIHHTNIVRLLGFCSEGTRRALIYEFMPKDSLEKYIFSGNSIVSRELLAPDKMLDIALGIARGIEYLHQGCNQRILHLDIKPNNILLDYSFNPKISDFGLAKLCARDQSIITLTAARGTMGYIAPELYSRNFGGISYKSDVYSFGMLVLEMVSGRRNTDPSIGIQNQVYLPEWIYEKVMTGEELVLTLEVTAEEQEKTRQLAIVALWCIQWNPRNRQSMTKVVNMLLGNLQGLQMPLCPI
ncbi:rust resistance kinase Lr10-like [Triticum urartu]|uniref:rust resistance kinase Lr10-like n=1 Tax=Triticum urartu TaxID=4572 RepID=UPI002042F54B|nr:rust resistance kinase Lr10-like [Triticum urartu]